MENYKGAVCRSENESDPKTKPLVPKVVSYFTSVCFYERTVCIMKDMFGVLLKSCPEFFNH